MDGDGDTDADERRDLLDGMLITFDDSDPEDQATEDTGDDEGVHRRERAGTAGRKNTPMSALADGYDAALFDLDGVVYLGPVAVEGAAEGIAALRAGYPDRLRHQ